MYVYLYIYKIKIPTSTRYIFRTRTFLDKMKQRPTVRIDRFLADNGEITFPSECRDVTMTSRGSYAIYTELHLLSQILHECRINIVIIISIEEVGQADGSQGYRQSRSIESAKTVDVWIIHVVRKTVVQNTAEDSN